MLLLAGAGVVPQEAKLVSAEYPQDSKLVKKKYAYTRSLGSLVTAVF